MYSTMYSTWAQQKPRANLSLIAMRFRYTIRPPEPKHCRASIAWPEPSNYLGNYLRIICPTAPL